MTGGVSDEELVRSLDDQERAVALTRDVAALERLWSDHFTVNAPNSQTATRPSAGLVAGQAVKRRFTNIWRNEAGTWRLFARHANVILTR